MIIIVESGATKSDWRILSDSGEQLARHLHRGMNVSSMGMELVKEVLSEGLTGCSEVSSDGLDGASFYMYTAGVLTDAIRAEIRQFVLSKGEFADFDLQTDLVGAARSVLGHAPGIAAIMGTGSNTCFFDGESVSQKVMSGGYVIGDDGSGATLGKLFLTDFIKNLIPAEVAEDFASKFDASYAAIVENVYRSGAPSGYLGTIAPFVVSHYDNPYIKEMVDWNFQRFIDRSLKQYDTDTYPVGIVGGFGYANKEIFSAMCERAGIRIARFLPEPVTGLIEYHCK